MSGSQTQRLGIVLSTVTEANPADFIEIARRAEDHGFEAVLVNEAGGDALACAQAIALRTERLRVGTNVANLYLRHPYLAAMSIRSLADLSGGRALVGFGISHRGHLEALGIDMGDARERLRAYLTQVRALLAGEDGGAFSRPSDHPVPLYAAGLTAETAALAGEVADGLMPFLPPRDYLRALIDTARTAARAAGRDAERFDCVVSIPTFVSENAERALSAARYNLAFFAQVPNYRRQWRRAGFGEAMDTLRAHWQGGGSRREAAALVPEALVEQVCVYGPAARCREQLEAFRAAGAAMPVLAVSPVDGERLEATRSALATLAP